MLPANDIPSELDSYPYPVISLSVNEWADICASEIYPILEELMVTTYVVEVPDAEAIWIEVTPKLTQALLRVTDVHPFIQKFKLLVQQAHDQWAETQGTN